MIAARIREVTRDLITTFRRQLVEHIIPDLVMAGGAAAMLWGVHFWSIAATWVVGGAMLIYISLALGPKNDR